MNQRNPDEMIGFYMRGHIRITDPATMEVILDKTNAIHYSNMSEALAYGLANKSQNYIFEMHFGNGATSVDPTGVINYLPPNTTGASAGLYNPTFAKIVDDTDVLNADPLNNKMEVTHVTGNNYSDILVTCLLDFGEPADQAAFDNSQNLNEQYVFDELGLKARATDGSVGVASTGKLLTHAVFHPVQKSLNRQFLIEYTVRVQSLTNLSLQA